MGPVRSWKVAGVVAACAMATMRGAEASAQRDFEVDVNVVDCPVEIPQAVLDKDDWMHDENPRLFAELFVDDKFGANTRLVRQDNPNWNGKFTSSEDGLTLEKETMVSIKLMAFGKNNNGFPIGWANISLPYGADLSTWDATKFGSKSSWSEPQFADLQYFDGTKHGGCNVLLKLQAEKCRTGEYIAEGDVGGCASCPKGHMCVGWRKTECPDGQYQDEEGQNSCKPCGVCPEDTFRDQCGTDSASKTTAGSCQTCGITKANRNAKCESVSVFVACDGTTFQDVARCYNCENYTASADDAEILAQLNSTDNHYKNCNLGTVNVNKSTSVTDGLPVWVLGVVISCGVVLFGVVVVLIRRKRKQMRDRMDELDRKAQSIESEQDLASSMASNMNPMFRKINPDTVQLRGSDAASIMHNQEVDELNKHKRALEDELRRLKKEKQQNEVALTVAQPSDLPKAKKKQFQGGDVALH